MPDGERSGCPGARALVDDCLGPIAFEFVAPRWDVGPWESMTDPAARARTGNGPRSVGNGWMM